MTDVPVVSTTRNEYLPIEFFLAEIHDDLLTVWISDQVGIKYQLKSYRSSCIEYQSRGEAMLSKIQK